MVTKVAAFWKSVMLSVVMLWIESYGEESGGMGNLRWWMKE
jgi:hypothetical protein